MPTKNPDPPIAFKSGALADEQIRLFGVEGRERISQLFEYKLYLGRESGGFTPTELDALVSSPCAVALGETRGDVIHGVLKDITMLDASGTAAPRYVATMVPTAWLLTLARTSRIFSSMNAQQVVAAVLNGYGLSTGAHYEDRVDASPTHEFIAQFEESDWNFIQRWLEHEGLFYWFEHGQRDRIVFADENEDASTIAAPVAISYRNRNDLMTGGESSVWAWQLAQCRTAARVALYDYNYRQAERMLGKASIDETRGFGTVMSYGENFDTAVDGGNLAQRRAEVALCQRRVFSGWTDCPRFRVGHRFDLEDHTDDSHNQRYLLTAVDVRVGLQVPSVDSVEEALSRKERLRPQAFQARFEAIPANVAFRPPLVTPKPRIWGVMNAHIDHSGAGDLAHIDPKGRYKVRMPYDYAAVGGTYSRWIRAAQSYSGSHYGKHFPLHKGAEVLVAHIHGDPDRPVIVGAVPHELTKSPVTSTNASQSVINTASGLRIELEDLQS